LAADPAYEGVASAVTDRTIFVVDDPAPWTPGSLASAAAPYFVEFLTGAERGRIIQVTANMANALTLDTTDGTAQTVSLTAAGFNVQAGDRFEVFAANTLASVFGTNTAQDPLLLSTGPGAATADTVGVYKALSKSWQTYYFDSKSGFWKLGGFTANANNTILYPNMGLQITRLGNQAARSFTFTGRVPEVAYLTKTPGTGAVVYASTGNPIDLTLSELNFGKSWVRNATPAVADTLALWNATTMTLDTYYQLPDSTWRGLTNAVTDQSLLVLPTGGVVAVSKRGALSGADLFIPWVWP
jgi:hypothetical protein